MFYDTHKLFTIGQFAKLHEINKKTLMWYDEIGILKPAVVKENGYRYYSFHQSSLLETILMLRELNVSIPEIQDFLKNRSASSLETLLADKVRELDDTISHLKALRAIMNETRWNMSALRNLDLSEVSIVEKPETHYLVTVPISQGIPFEQANYNRKCNSRRKRPTGRQQSGRIRESIKTYHQRRPSCELPPS